MVVVAARAATEKAQDGRSGVRGCRWTGGTGRALRRAPLPLPHQHRDDVSRLRRLFGRHVRKQIVLLTRGQQLVANQQIAKIAGQAMCRPVVA
jgi:hypothetical protein